MDMPIECMGTDESFVSINLDSQECELCHQDTGETLVSCPICLGPETVKLVKEGFNRIVHVDTKAHSVCFASSHRAVKNSVVPDPRISVYSQVDKIPAERISEVITGKIHGLLGTSLKSSFVKDVLMHGDCNNKLRVHSTPCTRTSSPVVSPRASPSHGPSHRRNSHDSQLMQKNYEESMSALQDSYIRYLFGGKIPSEWEESKENRLNRDDQEKETAETKFTEESTHGSAFEVKSNLCERTVLTNGNIGAELHRLCDNKKKLVRDAENLKDQYFSDENKIDADVSVVSTAGDDQQTTHDMFNGVAQHQSFQLYTAKQLEMYPVADILKIVNDMTAKVEGVSSHLVGVLQERDSVHHEISVRHATIAKLLKIKQQTVQEKQVLV